MLLALISLAAFQSPLVPVATDVVQAPVVSTPSAPVAAAPAGAQGLLGRATRGRSSSVGITGIDVWYDDALGAWREDAGDGPAILQATALDAYKFQVVVQRTGTGYTEFFRVQLPTRRTPQPEPLLVLFHAFGETAAAPLSKTTFDDEAESRNWFLVSPLGAAKKTYSSIESQMNIELVLDWMLANFKGIDRTRIYGVGFSMGGAACLNYAARHLDPAHAMFAAVVNHTGGVSQKHVWETDTAVQWILEFWFGGTPADAPFAYERSSLIDIDPGTLEAVQGGNDLARNLTHVPVLSAWALNDPKQNLVDATKALHKHLKQLGAEAYQRVNLTSTAHAWTNLDEQDTCNWLQGYQLTLPQSGATLADRDGRWFQFELHQEGAGSFTPFEWTADPAANRFSLEGTANLASLDVSCEHLGLDPGQPLTVELASADGTGDVVRLRGYDRPPAQVLRDGRPAWGWDWEPGPGNLVLVEHEGDGHLWEILP